MTNDQLWFSSLKSQPMRAEDRWPMTNHRLKKWLTSNTICLDRRSPTSTCSTQMYNMVYYGNILPLFVLCTHPNLLLVLPKRRKIMLISRWHSNQMYANVNTTFFIHIFIWWWNIPKSLSLFFVLATAISFTPNPIYFGIPKFCDPIRACWGKRLQASFFKAPCKQQNLSLIHIWRCRRYAVCRSRWSPYH